MAFGSVAIQGTHPPQTTSGMAVAHFLCQDVIFVLLFSATSSHPLGRHVNDPQGLIIQEQSVKPHRPAFHPWVWATDLLNPSPPLYICPN